MNTSETKLDTTVISSNPIWSLTMWSRISSWQLLSWLSFLELCSNKPWKVLLLETESTSDSLESSLFNFLRLQKTLKQMIRNVCFTNDAVFVADTERDLQRNPSCIVKTVQLSGLEVRLNRTDVWEENYPLHITLVLTKLKVIYHFTALEWTYYVRLKVQDMQEMTHL